EAWAAAGRPGLAPVPAPARTPGTAFGRALWLHAMVLAGGVGDTGQLLAWERPGGGWAGDAELLVPQPRGGGVTGRGRAARGVFTTATALRAWLAAAESAAESPPEPTAAPAAGAAATNGQVRVVASARSGQRVAAPAVPAGPRQGVPAP